jgi:hypothetical protein
MGMSNKTSGLILSAAGVMLVCAPSFADDDFKQWLQQEKSSFQQYKDERDKEFTEFLKTQWKEMELLTGFKRDESPKPVAMPVAKPQPVKPPAPVTRPEPEPTTLPVTPEPVVAPKPEPVVIKPAPAPVPVVKPVLPPEPKVVPKGRKLMVNYFGSNITFYYDPKLKSSMSGRINEKSVSGFWSALSLADYDALIEQVDAKAKALQLNDWAYALLVHEISKKIYPAKNNSQSLFTWFVLAKAGYKSRIAYNDRKVYLLVPSQQQLFSVPYFTFDKVRYYAVSFDGGEQSLGQVYTYDGNYPGADKSLNMRLLTEMVADKRSRQRKLSFEFEGKRYDITAAYDNQRVDFMKTYPQLDLKWYFKSEVSASATTPLQEQLREHMKGMNEQQAVNFLLRFVQTSLKYKTDEAQFGKENYMFPEETLHYPYSDCEDRSVLFAWLVQSLLGLDVVGLDFPGHVATAVHFKGEVAGDSVMHGGKRYVVADPTYINATAGMTMPDYKNTRPEIIRIR